MKQRKTVISDLFIFTLSYEDNTILRRLHMERALRINGRQYPIQISRRRGQKHIRIRISGSGTITLSCPVHTREEKISAALMDKEQWIRKHVMQISAELAELDPTKTLLIEGEHYTLTVIGHKRWKRGKLEIDSESKTAKLFHPKPEQLDVLHFLGTAMKKQADKALHQRAGERSRETGIPFQRLFIRNQKSRWGSSSTGGNISLNWRSYMLPPKLQDYLIIHELCHQLEANHSPRFWKQVEHYCPNYRTYDKELKHYARCMALFR